MALTVLAWLLFVFTVWGSGFILLRPFLLLRMERAALGFVVGATLLPFILFLVNTMTHASLLGEGKTGFFITIILVVIIFAFLFIELFSKRKKTIPKPELERISPLALFTHPIRLVLWLSLLIFFYLVVQGVTKPIYGWDEFSYWLYAAKLLYLSGGASTALRHDLYASYPLGFPYLVAWCYHFINTTSVSAAKWISPMVTIATLVVINRALVRSGVRSMYALFGISLVAWGSYLMLYYNWVAFGEMIYVDTYGIAMLYASMWLRDKQTSDLVLSGLVLGLSTFLRVDGDYIAIFTLVILYVSNWKSKSTLSLRQRIGVFVLVLVPVIVWHLFRMTFHIDSGWTTRVSLATISARLHPPVFPSLLHSMWGTIADMSKYPIDLLLPFLIITWPFSRRRDVFFLTAVILVQLAYLMVAYLTVFTTFEAMHASSLPRYMLRNDPLIAIAFTLLISGKQQNNHADRKRKKRTSSNFVFK
jgi:hypothetical protein